MDIARICKFLNPRSQQGDERLRRRFLEPNGRGTLQSRYLRLEVGRGLNA
jgi:hypothetical protein